MGAPALDAASLAERLSGEKKQYWVHVEAASPLDKYPAKQHARRAAEKLGVADGLIYLPGSQSRNNEDSDMPAKFRQRRYFYYLSGCNEPNCHLTYEVESDVLTLFIPRIDPKRVIWNGRGSTPAEALDRYDIDQVYFIDELREFLTEWAKYYRGSLYILHPSQNPLIPGLHEPVDSESLQPAMNLARMVKDEHEIALIKKANDISSLAHKQVLANILKFKNEAQVQGLFLDVCTSKQAKEQAYDPIAASGPNAGTLHYDANNEDFEDRQLMCLDAGCEYELYASDITRTFPLSGSWPSPEAKNIYRLVQRMQEACIERLAPGVRYLDLHVLAHQIAIDGLLSLGILRNGSREEIYKAGTSRAFFPHGLGHHVGLEVHDVGQAELMSATKVRHEKSLYPPDFHLPVYDSKYCLSPADPQSGHLEEGMVVTVEPGIYFSTYALNMFYLPHPIHSKYINVSVLQNYLPVGGVRIEDDILITSKGHENLTTAPKGEAMLEIIRSRNPHWPFISGSADLGPVDRTAIAANGHEKSEPLLRAPGISKFTPPADARRSLARATTLPPKVRRSIDFEPFNGESLFSGFKRASTIDVPTPSQRSIPTESASLAESESRVPICGKASPEFDHAYLDRPGHRGSISHRKEPNGRKLACRHCTILAQTLDRLRQNITKLESTIEPAPPKAKLQPAATRQSPDTGRLPRHLNKAIPNPAPQQASSRGPLPERWFETTTERVQASPTDSTRRNTLPALISTDDIPTHDRYHEVHTPSGNPVYQKEKPSEIESNPKLFESRPPNVRFQLERPKSLANMAPRPARESEEPPFGTLKSNGLKHNSNVLEEFDFNDFLEPKRQDHQFSAAIQQAPQQNGISERHPVTHKQETRPELPAQSLARGLRAPPSLPSLHTATQTNPFYKPNRHSVANPPPPPRDDQFPPRQKPKFDLRCQTCQAQNVTCARSSSSPLSGCDFCSQRGLACSGPLPRQQERKPDHRCQTCRSQNALCTRPSSSSLSSCNFCSQRGLACSLVPPAPPRDAQLQPQPQFQFQPQSIHPRLPDTQRATRPPPQTNSSPNPNLAALRPQRHSNPAQHHASMQDVTLRLQRLGREKLASEGVDLRDAAAVRKARRRFTLSGRGDDELAGGMV